MKENVNGGKTLTLGIFLFAGMLTALAAMIILFGKSGDIDKYLSFVLAIIPVTIGLLFISKQNNDIRSDVGGIKQKVNGELDRKFDAIHSRLDAISPSTTDASPAPSTADTPLPFDTGMGGGS